MTDIEAIRARAEAATPGPWVVPPAELYKNDTWHLWIATAEHQPEHPHSPKFIAWMTGGLGAGQTPRKPDTDTAADAEFIAHARQDVPALLAEVDRLTASLVAVELEARRQAAERMAADALVAALSEENAQLREALHVVVDELALSGMLFGQRRYDGGVDHVYEVAAAALAREGSRGGVA